MLAVSAYFVQPPHPHRNVQSGHAKGLTMIPTHALVISVGHWEANDACFIWMPQGVTCCCLDAVLHLMLYADKLFPTLWPRFG